MEDFSIENKKELNMSVSPICNTETGEKYAFVMFSDGVRSAEGKIPDCTIVSNKGFSEAEVQDLKDYMKENLGELKSMASSVNVFKAFTGDL